MDFLQVLVEAHVFHVQIQTVQAVPQQIIVEYVTMDINYGLPLALQALKIASHAI